MEPGRRAAAMLCMAQAGALLVAALRARGQASAAAASRRGWAWLQALGRRRRRARRRASGSSSSSGGDSSSDRDSGGRDSAGDEQRPTPAPTPAPAPAPAPARRPWARPRSTEWWDRTVLQTWDDGEWRQSFRMSAGTFRALCAELAPALRRQRTRMRLPLSVEKRVAIALWKLATAACYRAVGAQFGVGRSTAGAVVLEVCRAIQRVLLRRTVAWPGDARELLAGFGALGLPRCAGALGLAHTPIQCPPRQAADYINARGYYSMALQVLVDHRGRFTHVSAGWPGKAHPARVLRRSGLYRRGQQGVLFPAGAAPLRVGGVAVPLVVAGSAAHPLLPWLMTPFGEAAGAQGRFDAALARCRQPAERALARLRGRWRCLTARNDCAVDNLPRLVSACCVLHNLCERRGEPFDEAWAAEAQRLGASFQQPEARPEAPAEPTSPGARVRDALCAYMESQAQH